MAHDPNCAVVRAGDLRAYCDCGQAEREALPWYGGNKIPDSYLAKFRQDVEDEGVPYDIRLFMENLK